MGFKTVNKNGFPYEEDKEETRRNEFGLPFCRRMELVYPDEKRRKQILNDRMQTIKFIE